MLVSLRLWSVIMQDWLYAGIYNDAVILTLASCGQPIAYTCTSNIVHAYAFVCPQLASIRMTACAIQYWLV